MTKSYASHESNVYNYTLYTAEYYGKLKNELLTYRISKNEQILINYIYTCKEFLKMSEF